MFCRNVTSFICIFVATVIATAHNDSRSVTGKGSGPEVTIYPSTTENSEPPPREPEQQVMETTAVDLGALLDAGDGAVVTLVAGDTRLAAHRAVLVARSSVFAATLQHMILEGSGGQVVIPDVEGPVLRQMLAYMYTLQAPHLPSLAPQLLVAADIYGLSSLKAHCEQQVAAQLSVETAAAAAVLAVRHSCPSLRQAAISFIKTQLLSVMATQGWEDAMNSQPEDLRKVIQLVSDTPFEASVPATGGSGATPTTQQPSDHSSHSGQAPASAAQPTTSTSTFPSDDAVSCMCTPAAPTSSDTPATQPDGDHSSHSLTPASAAQSTAARHCPTTDYAAVCPLCTPAAPASSDTPATQPDRDHSTHSLTPASAAQSTVALHSPTTDYAAVCPLCTPALADNGTTPTIQAPSDHIDHSGPSPASAAPTTTDRHTPTPDYADVSPLRSLSSEEKNWRLIEAVKEGAVEEVEALLAAGADVDATDEGGWTALHWAAQRGHMKLARRLLAAGAAVEARGSWQWTPLHAAARRGHAAVVHLLVEEASADPNPRDWDAWTPLHRAAFWGNAEAAAALLRAGADKGAKNNWGRTPLDLARQTNQTQLIDILT